MPQTIKLYRGESVIVTAAPQIEDHEGLLTDYDYGFNTTLIVPLITQHRQRDGGDLDSTLWIQALEYVLVAVDGQAHCIEGDDYIHGIGTFRLIHWWDSGGMCGYESGGSRDQTKALVGHRLVAHAAGEDHTYEKGPL